VVSATLHADAKCAAGNTISRMTKNFGSEMIQVSPIEFDHLVNRGNTEDSAHVLDDVVGLVSGIDGKAV
jgi:hypothetical protein